MHIPNLVSRTLFALILIFGVGVSQASETTEEKPARVVIQVSEEGDKAWNFALNIANNVRAGFPKNGVVIELVAFGPGLGMVLFGTPVGNRLKEATEAGIQFSACENTMQRLGKKKEDLYPGIGTVPSGGVEIVKKQDAGWAYIRP